MRVVAGRYRGRRLEAPPGRSVRPTSERSREAAFSILEAGRLSGGLSPLPGARVLDAFAGTGALGIEAFSRGAGTVFFLERAPEALACLRRNLQGLEPAEALRVAQTDVLRPPPAESPCTLVLMDPPYGEGLAAPALAALRAAGWIAPETVILAETATGELDAPPPGFALLDQRRYGRARLSFLRLEAADLGPR